MKIFSPWVYVQFCVTFSAMYMQSMYGHYFRQFTVHSFCNENELKRNRF